MKLLFKKSGYVHDIVNDIWIRPTFKGISYSDGDEVEMRIASVIKQALDISVFSPELRQHCIDWPSLYHLSPTRSNIMRPFKKYLKGNALEIGAGCGAITRYLGESGVNVLALEGSPRRASIARSRTRDLENVSVLSEKFDQFQCDYQFDVITMIGVLEYANLFTSEKNPPIAMLERVYSLLKHDGILIIAIENQLGLKYFAGASEDHLGQPMVGIEGRYSENQPQTFGRKVLEGMLDQTSFASIKFFAPFPDYKLPVSIITEEGFTNKSFDVAAFAWQSVRRDPQLPEYCNFSLELAWPEVFKNELGMDVSNSFLVIASPNANQLINKGVLAYHYSVDRIPAYCKEAMFICGDGSDVRLEYRSLGLPNRATEKTNNHLIKFILPNSDEYVFGRSLSFDFIRIVTKDGWSFDQIARFIWSYLSIVEAFAKSENINVNIASPYAELPGEFFDIVPQNIIIREDGKPFCIDKEWQLTFPIEVAYLLFRSLILLINSITRFGKPVSQANMTRYQFIVEVLSAAGLRLQEEDFTRYIILEANIQQSVTGRDAVNFLTWGKDQLLPNMNLSQAVAERASQITSLNQVVAEREGQIAELNQAMANRDGQIAILKDSQRERDMKINQMYSAITRNTFIKLGCRLDRLSYRRRNEYHNLRREIKTQPLFDGKWYLAQYPDVNKSKSNPLHHYYFFGVEEGRNPNSYFDTLWYLNEYPDVARSGINPLLHYLRHGVEEGRNPNPFFDTRWYLGEYPDIADSGMNPLLHYLKHGVKEGRNPNPHFDTRWYLTEYPEVANSGVDPMLHYLKHGVEEGRNPNPYFDTRWYLTEYPDVAHCGMNPLLHYLKHGIKEGRNPNPFFDAQWYVKEYPDIEDGGMDPLLHYLKHGVAEGRNPNPYFDTRWYLNEYPDVARSGMDPLHHYLKYGAREGRKMSYIAIIPGYEMARKGGGIL